MYASKLQARKLQLSGSRGHQVQRQIQDVWPYGLYLRDWLCVCLNHLIRTPSQDPSCRPRRPSHHVQKDMPCCIVQTLLICISCINAYVMGFFSHCNITEAQCWIKTMDWKNAFHTEAYLCFVLCTTYDLLQTLQKPIEHCKGYSKGCHV